MLPTDTPAALGLVGLFLFFLLFLFLLAVLLLFLLPGGSLLCRLQGFFQVLGRLDGLAFGIDCYLYLVLHGRLDTPLFEGRLIVLREHKSRLLAGLPRYVAVIGPAFLIH